MNNEERKIKITIKKEEPKASPLEVSVVESAQQTGPVVSVSETTKVQPIQASPDVQKHAEKKPNAFSVFLKRFAVNPEQQKKKEEAKKEKERKALEKKAKKLTQKDSRPKVALSSLSLKNFSFRFKKGDEKKKKAGEKKSFSFSLGMSTKEMVLFSKRLAFLIRSGVPVLESLQILHKQARSRSRREMLRVIEADVANGRLLSDALGRFKRSFGDFSVNVIRIGEMSGTLSQNLTYLAEELHKRHALKRKVIGALVYPAFITVATVAVTVLLTVFIFPKVMPIFISLNVTLPFTTKVLLWISNFLRHYGFYTLGVSAVLVTIFIVLLRTVKKIHYAVSRTILVIPIIGSLVQNYNMTNFCRTMSLLLRSGFNVVEAAQVTGDSTPNPVYKKACYELHDRIVKGERISKFLEEQVRLFPDTVTHMVMIGETSGTLSDTLMYLAEHYEGEVDDMVKNLSNSIEPVLMVFMGLLVGFVAVSVITPIYEVTQHLSR